MNTRRIRRTATLLSALLVGASTAQAQSFGPTAYLRASDSPLAALNFSGGYFFLENFEDHLLNTSGATALSGGVTSVAFGPSIHDSVDGDDGLVDGSGLNGDSWFSFGASTGFSFSAAVLGALPTHAGLVWTDGPPFTGVTFQAFGADGSTVVCNITGTGFADRSNNGETAEDRFFGCASAGGISRIQLTNALGGGIEVDHLQYGRMAQSTVPEPTTVALVGVGIGLMFMVRRRRRVS